MGELKGRWTADAMLGQATKLQQTFLAGSSPLRLRRWLPEWTRKRLAEEGCSLLLFRLFTLNSQLDLPTVRAVTVQLLGQRRTCLSDTRRPAHDADLRPDRFDINVLRNLEAVTRELSHFVAPAGFSTVDRPPQAQWSIEDRECLNR